MNKLEAFWSFAYERQRIWHRRTIQRLPKPWTDDVIMQRYKFTNVQADVEHTLCEFNKKVRISERKSSCRRYAGAA